LADELVVVVLVSLVPLVVPIPVMFLGLFTSGIQLFFLFLVFFLLFHGIEATRGKAMLPTLSQRGRLSSSLK
jgi:hypothetical protein